MNKPPLDNLGLLHGCSSHWRLEHGAVMGVRHDKTEGMVWNRECGIACRDMGVNSLYHPVMGAAVYIALPLTMSGPLTLIGDRVIVWLARLTHGGYAGQVTLTVQRGKAKPTIMPLEYAELTNQAVAEAQQMMSGEYPADQEHYAQIYHDAGERLFEKWWLDRLHGLAQLAQLAIDMAAQYPTSS